MKIGKISCKKTHAIMVVALRSVDWETLYRIPAAIFYLEKEWKGEEEYLFHFCGLGFENSV